MRYILFVLAAICSTGIYAQVNLSNGLLAYYPFSGNTNDASGNGNNAVNFGATLTTDQGGNPNSAYYFDGINDYMRIAHNASFALLPQVSLVAKVKVQGFYMGTCYANCIIDKGINDFVPGTISLRFAPGNYTLSCFVVDSVHQNYYHDYNGVSTPATPINNPPYVQKDQWDCVVYTYDGTTSKFYVNSVLRYQITNPPATIANTSDIFMGKKNDIQYPYWFKGVMDEVRIYNRALNVQEVDSLCGFNPPPITDTIINKYAAVEGLQPCTNKITVDTATDFNTGDTVLMIQMKGAVIDSSNTAAFGTVTDYKGAGNYEYNVIKAKAGNVLTLKHPVVRDYDIPDGKVQIVRVPSFLNYTVNQPHTAMPWNGSKGGVFIINVDSTLTLNNVIDASGKGFRGATNTPANSSVVACNITSYAMGPNIDSSGMKGEGIAQVSASKSYGRGKLANGGGGGDAHNAGGGGGSNGNVGGIGGSQFFGCNGNPAPNVTGGVGGASLLYNNTSNKIFMGGGGGSTQANNGTVTTGGNGGGICIITARTIAGNNYHIKANGYDAAGCIYTGAPGICHDGMGGGGGGGTILVNVVGASSTVQTDVNGGKGGNESGDAFYEQVGPGGGGGGGIVWFKPAVTTNFALTLNGGVNGKVVYNNSDWGAQPGLVGHILMGLQFNFPVDTFYNTLVVDFSDSVVDCFTRKFRDLSVTNSSGGIVSWSWSFGSVGSSTQQNPTFTFPGYGTFPVTLRVTNGDGCMDSITQNITIPYVRFADAGNDTTICAGSTARLQASGGVSYSWSPIAGLSDPSAAVTDATVSGNTAYIVTVIDNKGCTDKDTVVISISNGAAVAIVSDNNIITGCLDNPVQLLATGAVSYTWSPGGYCDDSTSASPRVKPPSTTLFTVTGTDAGGCVSYDTVTVSVYYGSKAIFMPNTFSPNGDGRNDEIGPFILCGFTMEQFAVFNRWGQRVFSSPDPSVKWNGTYKNKPADTGTYYYFIKGKKDDGTTTTFKGDLTLIR